MSILSSSTPMSTRLHRADEFVQICLWRRDVYHNLHAPLLVLLELLSLVQLASGDGGPNPVLAPTCSLGPCLKRDAMATLLLTAAFGRGGGQQENFGGKGCKDCLICDQMKGAWSTS